MSHSFCARNIHVSNAGFVSVNTNVFFSTWLEIHRYIRLFICDNWSRPMVAHSISRCRNLILIAKAAAWFWWDRRVWEIAQFNTKAKIAAWNKPATSCRENVMTIYGFWAKGSILKHANATFHPSCSF